LIYAVLFAGFLWFSVRLIFKGAVIRAGDRAGGTWLHSTGRIGASTISVPAE
jgi:hypothetical protein